MTSEAILLIGRRTARSEAPLEAHATRLARRGLVDEVHTATYETEPVRELREGLAAITADRVYAVPMRAAHTFETLEDVPAALSRIPGDVHYCEPIGGSPAVTDVLASKAATLEAPAADVSLVLVGFGSSSKPYHRQTTEYHASRIEAEFDYGEVLPCYLLQNPTVECVRYNVSTDRAVAVPLFLARSEATEERIPEELELERGGIAYADPLGDHERVTDAVHAEVAKQRALAVDGEAETASFEGRLTANRQPVVTDGEGRSR